MLMALAKEFNKFCLDIKDLNSVVI